MNRMLVGLVGLLAIAPGARGVLAQEQDPSSTQRFRAHLHELGELNVRCWEHWEGRITKRGDEAEAVPEPSRERMRELLQRSDFLLDQAPLHALGPQLCCWTASLARWSHGFSDSEHYSVAAHEDEIRWLESGVRLAGSLPDHPYLCSLVVRWTNLLARTEKVVEARALVEVAYAQIRAIADEGRDPARLCWAEIQFGRQLLFELRSPEAALDLLEAAVARLEGGATWDRAKQRWILSDERFWVANPEREDAANPKDTLGQSLLMRGLAYAELGRVTDALADYERALRILEQTGNRHRVANTRANLGELLIEYGMLERAEQEVRHAMQAYGTPGLTAEGVVDDGGVNQMVKLLGRIARYRRDWRDAAKLYDKALSWYGVRPVWSEHHLDDLRIELAQAFLELVRRDGVEALDDCVRELDFFRHLGGSPTGLDSIERLLRQVEDACVKRDDQQRLAILWRLRASHLLLAKDFDRSQVEDDLARAAEEFTRGRLHEELALVHAVQARLHEQLGDPRERLHALSLAARALAEHLDDQRLHLDRSSSRGLRWRHRQLLDDAVEVFEDLAPAASDDAARQDLFDVVQVLLGFEDVAASRSLWSRLGAEDPRRGEIEDLGRQKERAEQEIHGLVSKEDLDEHGRRLDALVVDLEERRRKVELDLARGVVAVSEPLRIGDFCAALDAKQGEVFVVGLPGAGRAMVLRPDGSLELRNVSTEEQREELFRQLAEDRACEVIRLNPRGVLARGDIHALSVGEKVLDDFVTVALAPSPMRFHAARSRGSESPEPAARELGLIAMGNPYTYAIATSDSPQDAMRPGGRGLLDAIRSGSGARPSSDALPATGEEVRDVLDLLRGSGPLDGKAELVTSARQAVLCGGKGEDFLLATGKAATEARLVAALEEVGLVADRLIVHLACHGWVTPGRAETSYLELAVASGDASGGLLTALDLSHLDLRNVELLVLSACESSTDAEGQLSDELDGPLGLAAAGLAAGARRVLATTAEVPDKATSQLIVDFYHEWVVQGREPAEALREARRQSRQRGHTVWRHVVLLEAQ